MIMLWMLATLSACCAVALSALRHYPRTAAAIGATLTVWACSGCATDWQAQAHGALDRLTDYGDPLYGAVALACDAREGAILAHPTTTTAVKRTQIDATRRTCDVVVQAFEHLRTAQITARRAVDLAAAGQMEWRDAARAAQDATQALEGARTALQGVTWLREAAGRQPR